MNSNTGKLVMLLVSNHEHGASVLHGNGWKDGKLSFETAPENPKLLTRERFTFYRDSPTTFHTVYEWSLDGGKT